MSDEPDFAKAFAQMQADTRAVLAANPSEATGCCVITTAGGYSERKEGITKAACEKHGGPGFSVTWTEGKC